MREDAENISEMKSNLITFATHELKVPLEPILDLTELLKKSRDGGLDLNNVLDESILDSNYHAARRLEQIINAFLDVGRIGQGPLPLEKGDFSITELLQEAIDSTADLAKSSKVSIQNQPDETMVLVDRFRIVQVFTNLLSNAIKFSPPGSEVNITTALDGDFVVINFTDQGYGFTPEDLETIRRLISPPSDQNDATSILTGASIGLSLAKTIIEQHGGTIEITSAGRNQGTNVRIVLPREEA